MDALSNPNAFASGQKQKDEKMKELGIEESAQSKAATTGGKVKDEEVKRGQYINQYSYNNIYVYRIYLSIIK